LYLELIVVLTVPYGPWVYLKFSKSGFSDLGGSYLLLYPTKPMATVGFP